MGVFEDLEAEEATPVVNTTNEDQVAVGLQNAILTESQAKDAENLTKAELKAKYPIGSEGQLAFAQSRQEELARLSEDTYKEAMDAVDEYTKKTGVSRYEAINSPSLRSVNLASQEALNNLRRFERQHPGLIQMQGEDLPFGSRGSKDSFIGKKVMPRMREGEAVVMSQNLPKKQETVASESETK